MTVLAVGLPKNKKGWDSGKPAPITWVNVSKGAPAADLVEVFGPLSEGVILVKRASDEIRNGSALAIK